MQFNRSAALGGRFAFHVELSDYDSPPPATQWLIDSVPENIDPNRQAIALFLVFGKWCGGAFTLPHQISPHTAEAISSALRPALANVGPIEYYPKGLPIGTRCLSVTDDPRLLGEGHTFLALRSDQWAGFVRAVDSVILSSNSFVFQENSRDIAPLVGLAVLFADSLSVDRIYYPGCVSVREFRMISQLLASVRLGFEVSEIVES